MSNRELAKNIIDRLPEDKMIFILNILENIGEMSGISLHPEFTPNEETQNAIADKEIPNGNSVDDILQHLTGILPDTGKTLEEYQEERRQERYGITH